MSKAKVTPANVEGPCDMTKVRWPDGQRYKLVADLCDAWFRNIDHSRIPAVLDDHTWDTYLKRTFRGQTLLRDEMRLIRDTWKAAYERNAKGAKSR